jgi:SAM-dependent methyltransferase
MRPAFNRLLEPLRALIERDKMRFVRGLPPGARVLEVGAGDGRFISRLRVAGFDASGIEPSVAGVRLARARAAPVEQAAVEEVELEPASLDAALAWHTIEHLEDPAAALSRIVAWLRPGGLVIVACPNLASLQARIGGDRWFHQDVPRHRTHFTAVGLRLLLRRTGFRVLDVSHLVVEQNPLGMWQTLLNLLTFHRDFASEAASGRLRPGTGRGGAAFAVDVVVTLLAAIPTAFIAVLLEAGAVVARRGGVIEVEAEQLPATD